MPSPSTSLATLRPDLGGSFMEWALEARRRGYIASRVMPVFEAMKASGTFGKIPIEELLAKRTTRRAPGAGYSRGDYEFTTDTYACEEHGAEEPVDDREAEMYRDYFDAEQVSAFRALDAVLRNAEQRCADALFNATTFTVTNVTNEWDDLTNAVPITDVEDAVQRVWDASGLWCNALIINRKVFRNVRRCAQIVDQAKYQGFMDVRAGRITEAILAQVFDLDFVIVAGEAKNTADEGQSASLSPIWSNEYAMVARVAVSNDIREPCVGRTFHWAEDGSQIGATVESYRDENVRSDVVRARHDVDEKVLYVEAADLIGNITT